MRHRNREAVYLLLGLVGTLADWSDRCRRTLLSSAPASLARWLLKKSSGAIPSEDVNEVNFLTKEGQLMSAANWSDRIPSARSNPVAPVNQLAERVGYYFNRHPEASREEFLLAAQRREVDWREQQEHHEASRCSSTRRPLSAEDIRLHAWLNERLAVLHYERQGLWPRLRRFFYGND